MNAQEVKVEMKPLVLGEEALNFYRPWEGEIGTKLIWLLFICIFILGRKLIYNAMLVSATNQP